MHHVIRIRWTRNGVWALGARIKVVMALTRSCEDPPLLMYRAPLLDPTDLGARDGADDRDSLVVLRPHAPRHLRDPTDLGAEDAKRARAGRELLEADHRALTVSRLDSGFGFGVGVLGSGVVGVRVQVRFAAAGGQDATIACRRSSSRASPRDRTERQAAARKHTPPRVLPRARAPRDRTEAECDEEGGGLRGDRRDPRPRAPPRGRERTDGANVVWGWREEGSTRAQMEDGEVTEMRSRR